MPEKRLAAYVSEAIRSTTDPDLYVVALIQEDEPGFYEYPYAAPTLAQAQIVADAINAGQSNSSDDVLDIVASSFRASNFADLD